MVKQMRVLGAFAVAILGVVSATSCAKTDEGVGGETNWLIRCDSNDECGRGATCECGVCTKACTNASACASVPGSTCAQAGSAAYSACASPPSGGVCLATCAGGCKDGATCTDGICVSAPLGDGGACRPLPCPSGAPWNQEACACVAQVETDSSCIVRACSPPATFDFASCQCMPHVFFDGGQCEPSPCPSETRWNAERCLCESIPDSGSCRPLPCPSNSPWNQAACACIPMGELDSGGALPTEPDSGIGN